MMVRITKEIRIEKTDAPQRLAFGWASVIEEGGIPVVDRQGDVMSEADLEAMAYDFVEKCRVAGEMHSSIGVGDLVESTVFTKAKQAALGIDLGRVGWWIGFRLSPDVFAKVADGTYRAFSIGGTGQRVPLAKATPKAVSFGDALRSRLGIQAPAKVSVTTRPATVSPQTSGEHPLVKAVKKAAADANAAAASVQVGKAGEHPLVTACRTGG